MNNLFVVLMLCGLAIGCVADPTPEPPPPNTPAPVDPPCPPRRP